MKLALVGQQGSGRGTFFEALGGAQAGTAAGGGLRLENRIQTVEVQDERLHFVAGMFKPKKVSPARIEYWLPAQPPGTSPQKGEAALWSQVRLCDGLLQLVRNFKGLDGAIPDPWKDYRDLEEDMILADLSVAEKRLERIALDLKRGRKPEGNEAELLAECRALLSQGTALRSQPQLAGHPELRGYAFLSAKPQLVVLNNDDEDDSSCTPPGAPEGVRVLAVRARLERDLRELTEEEASEFREAYNIKESALQRVVRHSLDILERISFFTVNDEEAKAWPVRAGTPALEAAGTVHSDIQRGFIRAEVLAVNDLRECGSLAEAKKRALLRLEGKEYVVQDGDLIYFRFNV